MRRTALLPAFLAAVAIGLPVAMSAQQAPTDPFELARSYVDGQNREHLTVIEHMGRDAASDSERKQVAAKLAGLLEAGTSPDCKRFACRQLALVGGSKEVPAIEALLGDAEVFEMAVYALQRIPDDQAAKALRKALEGATGDAQLALITALGEKGDKEARKDLKKLLESPDRATMQAAADALALIGGEAAFEGLEDRVGKESDAARRGALEEALAACLLREKTTGKVAKSWESLAGGASDPHVKAAALRGWAMASPDSAARATDQALASNDPTIRNMGLVMVRQLEAPGIAKVAASKVATVDPAFRARLLLALGDRGDAAALPAASGAVGDEDAAVRAAALEAVSRLGDSKSVALLAPLAGDEAPVGPAAAAGLARLRGKGVTEAMIAQLPGVSAAARAAIIGCFVDRHDVAAATTLLGTAKDSERRIRDESWSALGALAEPAQVPAMVDLLLAAESNRDRENAGKAIVAAIRRDSSEARLAAVLGAVDRAEPPARGELLNVLSSFGGDQALALVRRCLGDSSEDVRTAAIRSLGQWPDPAPSGDLIRLAKEAPTEVQQVLALRGFIRLAGLNSSRDAKGSVEMYRIAMETATRPDEKNLALSGLGDVSDLAALKLAEKSLDDPALKDAACPVCRQIAWNIRQKNPDEAKAMLQRLLDMTSDQKLRQTIRENLSQLNKVD